MANQTTAIPKGWKMTTLGEVADKVEYGYTESASNIKIGPKFLRITDIQNDFIDWETVPYCSISDKDFLKYRLKVGDVVIARTGNSTGASATIKDNTEAVFASYLIRFKLDKEIANFKYIDFLFRSNFWKKFVVSVKGGSAQGGANAKDFSTFPIQLPPLPEQCAIAAVLSSLDDKIELLREQNKTLEATAQAIFKEWFVNFNFPGATGKMINSELGKIPEGWKVGKIKDLVDILSGFAFQSFNFSDDGKYKLVTIKNVQDKNFVFGKTDKILEIPSKMPDYCKLDSGDILLSLTGNVGRVCLVVGDDFLLNQRVAKLKSKNEMDYAFAYFLFLQDSIFYLLQSTASGTAQQNLSPIQTKEIDIVVPDRKTLDEFGLIGNSMIRKINENNFQIQILSKLRDTLLPKLMRGEVRVKKFKD